MPYFDNRQTLLAVLMATSVLVACGDDEAALLVENNSCASGLSWPHGDEGSEMMHPGGDCISCHGQSGQGPSYEIAGTVYASLTEEDDCAGLEGAVIEITDADQRVFTMASNAAGNFFMSPEEAADIRYPARVKAIYMGRENPMLGLLPYGNCTDCHTRNGNWTATGGRVYVAGDGE